MVNRNEEDCISGSVMKCGREWVWKTRSLIFPRTGTALIRSAHSEFGTFRVTLRLGTSLQLPGVRPNTFNAPRNHHSSDSDECFVEWR